MSRERSYEKGEEREERKKGEERKSMEVRATISWHIYLSSFLTKTKFRSEFQRV